MILTAEISMFPFNGDYKPLIKSFIARLNEHDDLRVDTGPTSTVIVGEYGVVMDALKDLLKWSFETHGRAVFVTKFFPDYNPKK